MLGRCYAETCILNGVCVLWKIPGQKQSVGDNPWGGTGQAEPADTPVSGGQRRDDEEGRREHEGWAGASIVQLSIIVICRMWGYTQGRRDDRELMRSSCDACSDAMRKAVETWTGCRVETCRELRDAC